MNDKEITQEATHEFAKQYIEFGLSVIPVKIDGTKQPSWKHLPYIDGKYTWKPFQELRPTVGDAKLWFKGMAGIAIVCGRISHNLAVIDFESHSIWNEFLRNLKQDDVDKLIGIPFVKTGGGGTHLYCFIEDDVTLTGELNGKLARKEDGETLIEIRGEGNYVVAPGSPLETHKSGNPYQWVRRLEDCERMSLEQYKRYLEVCSGMNRYREVGLKSTQTQSNTYVPISSPVSSGELKPGDDFNRRADWIMDILEPAGWTVVDQSQEKISVSRPGRKGKVSATIGYCKGEVGGDLLYIFSTSAGPFEQGKTYSKFGAYSLLVHFGDIAAAAKKLREDGYGSIREILPTTPFPKIKPKESIKAKEESEREEDKEGEGKREEEEQEPNEPKNPGLFPVELLDVPGFIGEVIKYNMETCKRKQPVLALAAALSLLATLTGRKIESPTGLRTNLYVIGTAPSGKGKEHARSINIRILGTEANRLENSIGATGMNLLIGPDSLHSESAVVNLLAARRTSLMQIDEFGIWLQSIMAGNASPHAKGIARTLMNLFTKADSEFRGGGHADITKNTEIPYPHLVIYGTSTPDELDVAMRSSSVVNGFLSRMLIFEGDSRPERVDSEQMEIPNSILEFAAKWYCFGVQPALAGKALTVPMTDDARKIFSQLEDYAEAQEDLLSGDQEDGRAESNSGLGTLWTRASEKAIKLALLYAASLNVGENCVIDYSAASWGCTLSQYLTERMIWRASRHTSENEEERLKKKIFRIIEQSGMSGILKKDLTRKTQFIKGADRDNMLKDLISAGLIAFVAVKTSVKNSMKFFTTSFIPNS